IETTARRGATTPAGARLARDRRKAASASEIGRPRDAAAEEKRRMNPPRGAALCRALFDRARHSVVLQAEAAECGLACLAMVCRHYGDRTELAELRRRFPLSLKGTTLADLVRIAARLGFRSRPLSLALERLPGLALPAILHWDMRHFVVLASASRSRLVILDPAAGRRRLRAAEASAHFTGVALELAPT